MSCRRCIISGRVQGVYYRASTQRQAGQLGLSGFARNRTDGTVEVVACGDSESTDALEQWLWRGSKWSVVESVRCHPLENGEEYRVTTGLFSTQ
ncbi:MAG: acylphosphatase [Gammaproteobacteria bacterium]|jgi:acylphosphatase|nr:acylphosphatase [Gammaproteobacteria bacterium]